MRLYERMYGWSMDRMFASAFMAWIAGSIVWFGATTLRGAANRFPFGALVGGLGVIAGLVVLNPAAVVVENHARRLSTGRKFDASYAANLRADGIPTLLASLADMAPALNAEAQCSMARAFENAQREGQTERWPSWNWGRSRAVRAVHEHQRLIGQVLGEAPCARFAEEQKAAAPPPPAAAPPAGELPAPPPGLVVEPPPGSR
jgi:hypothetical protein